MSEFLQIKCLQHKQSDVQFIQINQNEKDKVFYCSECIVDEKPSNHNSFISIKSIIENDIKLYEKWPPIDNDQISDQIIKLISLQTFQISELFKKLRSKIEDKINKLEQEILNRAQESKHILKQIHEKFNSNFLKEILKDQTIDTRIKQLKCQEIINKAHQQKSQNKQQLFDILNHSRNNNNLIKVDFKILFEKQQLNILSLIDQINFFSENPNQKQSTEQNEKQELQNYSCLNKKNIQKQNQQFNQQPHNQLKKNSPLHEPHSQLKIIHPSTRPSSPNRSQSPHFQHKHHDRSISAIQGKDINKGCKNKHLIQKQEKQNNQANYLVEKKNIFQQPSQAQILNYMKGVNIKQKDEQINNNIQLRFINHVPSPLNAMNKIYKLNDNINQPSCFDLKIPQSNLNQNHIEGRNGYEVTFKAS